jgi:hypothetical protein
MERYMKALILPDEFRYTSVSGRVIDHTPPKPLGLLTDLVGKWVGTGFNQIWRPLNTPPTQDHFLELNETSEEITFIEIPGDIPNRGLLQDAINLHGMTYLQVIKDANAKGPNGKPAGLHIEPGIWVSVPLTANPAEPPTVARMANIPHGTAMVAQGGAFSVNSGPVFDPVSITPFVIGNPTNLIPFPETDLSTPSVFRTPPTDIPHVTQSMVDNPNDFLASSLIGKTIVSTIVLNISTVVPNQSRKVADPSAGGGTANIAFLQGAAAGPNASAAQVDATFWINTTSESHDGKPDMLQYSQRVLLNFKGLSWPHVSVGAMFRV